MGIDVGLEVETAEPPLGLSFFRGIVPLPEHTPHESIVEDEEAEDRVAFTLVFRWPLPLHFQHIGSPPCPGASEDRLDERGRYCDVDFLDFGNSKEAGGFISLSSEDIFFGFLMRFGKFERKEVSRA